MIEVRPVAARLKAIAALALIGAMAFSPPAFAQQPQQVEFSTYELFAGPDSVDLRADSIERLADTIRKAQTPGSCPLGRLRIRVAEGDPLFQKALMAARRDAVLGRLQQMGVPVAGRLFVETEMFGGPEGHDTVYESPRDGTPPTLRTNSDPPKGSKVKARQQIIVRMAARDDADRWQTGIKTIQLVADSEGGRFIASENYEPCSDPKEKRVQATYEVPADPPPIVRLTALAEDHAGLMDTDTAEFPTGDFYGTLTVESASRYSTRADIVLNHDGKGNLTGTMVGQQQTDFSWDNGRCYQRTIRPNRFRVSLVGSYTEVQKGSTLKVFIKEIEETKIREETWCKGSSVPPFQMELGFKMRVWAGEAFLGTPSALGEGEVLADGSRQYKWADGPPGNTTVTVTLHRARN